MTSTLSELERRIRRQTDEIVTLVDGLDDETLARAPAAGRWSVGQHLDHVCRTVEPYADAMEAAVEKARARGLRPGDGDLASTWFGRTFTAMLEPPPRRRMKTFGVMRPAEAPRVDPDATVADFRRLQERLPGVLAAGSEVDLGRARMASPVTPLLFFVRFPVHEAAGMMAAHTDRHLWLMREALEQMGER